jgi:hypothetical protein
LQHSDLLTAPLCVVWRQNPRIELHWRDWGSDSVVLEAISGQTYQFEALAAAAMACFEEQEHSLKQLATALASDLDIDVDDELRDALLSIIDQFVKLGWLEPIDCT